MKKIKVLNIITRLDRGGSAENTLYTVAYIQNDRFENSLVSGPTNDPDGSILEYIRANNIDVIFLPSLVRQINPFKDIASFFWLYRHIKSNKFDIVHVHTSKAGVIGRWAAFFAGVKKIIYTPHGNVFYGYYGRMKSSLFIIIEKLTALITDKIITLTPKGIYEQTAYGIAPKEKFLSIHSGIDIDNYLALNVSKEKKLSELGIENGKFVVGSVTRFERVKDNATLIKAFNLLSEEMPESLLVLAGDGSQKSMLQDLAKYMGIADKVKFLGLRADVPEVMSIFDIFALSSINEGMGKVFIQAASLGKPVVATNVGGVESVVLHNKTGYLVPSGDYKALGDALIEVARDPIYAKSLGDQGKEWVTGTEEGLMRYSKELMIRKIERLYAELAGF